VRPEWVREVSLLTDSSGRLKDVIIILNIPVNERPPALSISFGKVEVMFEHGKSVARKAEIRIRF
jgi:hypothetical protein